MHQIVGKISKIVLLTPHSERRRYGVDRPVPSHTPYYVSS